MENRHDKDRNVHEHLGYYVTESSGHNSEYILSMIRGFEKGRIPCGDLPLVGDGMGKGSF